jgi:hypothetical protein
MIVKANFSEGYQDFSCDTYHFNTQQTLMYLLIEGDITTILNLSFVHSLSITYT